jgi:hypothetical protein
MLVLTLIPGILRLTRSLAAEQMLELQFEHVPPKQKVMEAQTSCAICFFGLPRSFGTLVLPSVVKEVLIPNLERSCDIFLHHYDIGEESPGRVSNGGKIDSTSVYQLQDKVEELYKDTNGTVKRPEVTIVVDTDETFWEARGEIVEKYRHTKGPDGHFKYFPWKDSSYEWPSSTDNIVKQWHSIQTVWNAMEEQGKRQGKNYTRVAMLRNDVVYVKPIDIFKTSQQTHDSDNEIAVIPRFAKHPVSDRMIYGPYGAVKVWATERFSRLEEHVQTYKSGYGMHSERFMAHSILPGIEEKGFKVELSPHICFFRARADGTVFLKDCNDNSRFKSISLRHKMKWVEDIAEVTCNGFIGTVRTTFRKVKCLKREL